MRRKRRMEKNKGIIGWVRKVVYVGVAVVCNVLNIDPPAYTVFTQFLESHGVKNRACILEKDCPPPDDFSPLDEIVVSASGVNPKFLWPVSSRQISLRFHDEKYPFAKYISMSGVHINAEQGSPVSASSGGVVTKVKNNPLGYSYIQLTHDGGYSTVYGSLSAIMVEQDDRISQGDLIGYSGGTPGTFGAGRLSTGPGLHFEVRLHNKPLDPMEFEYVQYLA